MPDTVIYIDLIQAPTRMLRPRRAQRWRWRAVNGLNFRVLAVSSEPYTNKADALAAITQLFGAGSNIYLRAAGTGNTVLRQAETN